MLKFASPVALLALLLGTSIACDDGGDGDDTPEPDAFVDPADAAPPDAPPPPPDAAPPADARPADLSCVGQTPTPGTPPDPLTISGAVLAVGAGGAQGLTGAQVSARLFADDSVLASTESGAMGAYSLMVPTGGVATEAYLRAAATDHVTSNLFPPFPADDNITGLSVITFPTELLGLLASIAGVTVVPGDGMALLQIEDCGGQAIIGATVAIGNGGNKDTRVMYAAGSMSIPDGNATATDESGLVYVFNLDPEANLYFYIDYMGTSLRHSPMKTFADEASFALAFP